MATADAGLFGPSPWEALQMQQKAEQDRQLALQTQASNFAQLNAAQRGAQGMFTAGGQLGNMLNPQPVLSPAVQQAAQNQKALQGADLQTPEGLRAAAKKMLDMGNQQLAIGLIDRANKLEDEISLRDLRKAQAKKAENYQAPGSQDPETIKLLDRMSELEAAGQQDSAEYKALEGRVKFLQTAKGGAFGNLGTYQLVPLSGGQMLRVNKATGESSVVTQDGQPITVAQYDPNLKALMTQAGAGGKVIGEGSGQAQLQLPKIEQQVTAIKSLGNQLFAHPGYQQLVGAGFPGLKALAGSNVPGAAALFGNIQGIAYLMAREELRGQGQVTEGEANMALAAFNRMNTTMNEKDFKDAYADFVQRVENVRELLKTRSKMKYESPVLNTPQVSAPSPAAPMPQGAVPATPVAPMPFNVVANNKNEVKAAYKAGKFGPVGSPEALNRANIILNQME